MNDDHDAFSQKWLKGDGHGIWLFLMISAVRVFAFSSFADNGYVRKHSIIEVALVIDLPLRKKLVNLTLIFDPL